MTLTQQGISITPCFKKHIETLCYEEGVVLGETITQFPCLVRTINQNIWLSAGNKITVWIKACTFTTLNPCLKLNSHWLTSV